MAEPASPALRDDAFADVIAAVQACRAGDREGFGVLLRYGDAKVMAAMAVRLVAEVAAERGWTGAELREWAAGAVLP